MSDCCSDTSNNPDPEVVIDFENLFIYLFLSQETLQIMDRFCIGRLWGNICHEPNLLWAKMTTFTVVGLDTIKQVQPLVVVIRTHPVLREDT